MVYIILGEGFEETEAIAPGDLLRRAGAPVCYAGIGGRRVTGSHGIVIEADVALEELDLTQLEMIVLPGGLQGVETILKTPAALEAVRFAYENGKFVAAICAAPTILARLGITDGKKAVCYPAADLEAEMTKATLLQQSAVQDGNVITGASAGCAVAFGLELVKALQGAEAANSVEKGIVIR